MNTRSRRHQEGDARSDNKDRVLTTTMERAQAHMRRMPLAGSRPLHNDETICLYKVKRAINDFFNIDQAEEAES